MAGVLVMGAAIVRHGRVLAARRTSPTEHAGGWEFPGGKVEPGEDPDSAVVREVREELGCEVVVTGHLSGDSPIAEGYVLQVAIAELIDGEPIPHEHDAIRWLGPEDLDVNWLRADLPFLAEIRQILLDVHFRGVFYAADDARAVVSRLVGQGFNAEVARERFAGEDDDEDHAWAVVTDAPKLMLVNLLEEYDGWLDIEDPAETRVEDTATPPVVRRPQPLDLPQSPKRASVTGPTVAPMDERMLLLHAHPDDESIGQGATMAKYVARGTQVTLVTCTLGEEGEVLVPELAHLAAEHDDQLGQHRLGELALAMKELGVTDYRFLGGAGKYRDSGMAWHEEGHAIPGDEVKDGTFWRADLLEASNYLIEIIREVRPQVLVTYDEFGGYGHPDHIQAHRVATYAASLAAVPSYRPDLGTAWDIAKIYWGAMSESRMRAALRHLRESGDTTMFEGMDPEGPLPPFITPDENLATCVDANDFVGAKLAAMKAHATQIAVDGPFFALSNNIGDEVWGTEFYRLAKGTKGPTDESGLESDLFAGL